MKYMEKTRLGLFCGVSRYCAPSGIGAHGPSGDNSGNNGGGNGGNGNGNSNGSSQGNGNSPRHLGNPDGFGNGNEWGYDIGAWIIRGLLVIEKGRLFIVRLYFGERTGKSGV